METCKRIRTEKDRYGRFHEASFWVDVNGDIWLTVNHYETHGSCSISGDGYNASYEPYDVVVQSSTRKIVDQKLAKNILPLLIGE